MKDKGADRLAEIHAQLAANVDSLTSGDAWRAMLEAASRFHDYSWRNVMLIVSQRPDATRVAGYRVWQSLGRQVRKGEHGISILAPIVARKRTDDDGTDDDVKATGVRGWRVATVFDVSQTDGEDLPDVDTVPVTGEAPDGLWEALAAQVGAAGFTLLREQPASHPDAYGEMVRSEQVVRVRPDVDTAHACKTLAHELAHVLLGHGEQDCRSPRSVGEVEAESVAYVVAQSAGLDTADYSTPYVAMWADRAEEDTAKVIAATATRVLATARGIVAALEAA